LRGWLDEDRAGLLTHRRLTEATDEWSKNDDDPSYLYRGMRLTEAREWVTGHRDELNMREREFLYMSALYEVAPEDISWAEVLASRHLLALFTAALKSDNLSSRAQREAITSLSHWARNRDTDQKDQATTLLGEIASGNDDSDIRFLAVEKMWLLGGTEMVSDWWTGEQETMGPDGINLLARLWDCGVRIIPADFNDKRTMLWILLQNRWQQRKEYIIRWILFGAAGSMFLSAGVGSFVNLGLATNVPGNIVLSTIAGLGFSFGLSWGELFEGWLRVIIRTLAGVVLLIALLILFNLLLTGAPPYFFSMVMIATFLYTLFVGIGPSIGELWPKYPNLGYIAVGCLAISLVPIILNIPFGSTVLFYGVVIGTGIAQMGNRSS